jgi:hypothetical protein
MPSTAGIYDSSRGGGGLGRLLARPGLFVELMDDFFVEGEFYLDG